MISPDDHLLTPTNGGPRLILGPPKEGIIRSQLSRCDQARFRRGLAIRNCRYEAKRSGWVGAPLPDYRFCAAHRDRDGLLSAPLHEEIIAANGPTDAAARAKAIELDMTSLKVNALYLVDANGHVVWSLRIADLNDDHS